MWRTSETTYCNVFLYACGRIDPENVDQSKIALFYIITLFRGGEHVTYRRRPAHAGKKIVSTAIAVAA
jgi:hypothetical protein